MTEVSLKQPDNQTEILEENEDWHDEEAQIYDHIRSELWNFYEQQRITNDVNKIQELSSGTHVVDVGSGTGNLVLKFADLDWEIEAVDISEKMIEVLKDKVPQDSRVNFHHSKADDFLSDSLEQADTICFSSVLHHLPDYYQTLKKAVEKIPPRGVIYIVHEPLPSKVRRDDDKLDFIDKLLTPRSSFHKWQAPEKESDMIDYHIDRQDGIELSELKSFLRKQGMKIIEEGKYTTWKSGVLAGFDDIFELTNRTDFKLIAQKQP